MAAPEITWTPTGGSARTVELPETVTAFDGFMETDSTSTVSVGGKAVTLVYDVWHEYSLEIKRIGPTLDRYQWGLLTSWWAHAARGSAWSFTLDGDQTFDSTTTGAITQDDTTFTVASTTGLSSGDWLYFEDPDDPTLNERKRIVTVDSSTQCSIEYGFDHDLASAAVVRHADYFPSCLVLQNASPLQERSAGAGPYWDFKLKFRTVR